MKLAILPARVIPARIGTTTVAPSPAMGSVELLRAMVLSLPFWRAGRDVKKLDAQLDLSRDLAAAKPCKGSQGIELRMTADAQGYLGEAMEAAGATIQDHDVNTLFSEVMRSVLVAADEPKK